MTFLIKKRDEIESLPQVRNRDEEYGDGLPEGGPIRAAEALTRRALLLEKESVEGDELKRLLEGRPQGMRR